MRALSPLAGFFFLSTFALGVLSLRAADTVDPAVAGFLKNYCLDCHGPKKQKGDFRVDTLKLTQSVEDAEYWQLVLDNLHLGEMPPEDETQPPLAELTPVTDWIEAELKRAAAELAGHRGEVVLRRLNRVEYEYTVDDLFGIRGNFAEGFPADTRSSGFDNIGAALSLSAEQMDQYLKAADFILERAIQTKPRPETKQVTFTLHDYNQEAWKRHHEDIARRQKEFDQLTPDEQKRTTEMVAQLKENPNLGFSFPAWESGKLREPKPEDGSGVDAVIAINAGYAAPDTRRHFQVREPGWYRFKITAYAASNEGRPVHLKLASGSFAQGTIPDVMDVVQLTDATPRDYEYRVYLQPNQIIKMEMIDGENWAPREKLVQLPGPFVAIRQIEMEGPLIDEWPPKGHRLLLGERDASTLTDDEAAAALAEFAPKLFRRPVPESTVGEFVEFYRSLRPDLAPLEAFKLTAKAMMTSPYFVYQIETGESLDAFALANRLSYFLWRSAPDAELMDLASSGALSQPTELARQVDRLLADEKSERFLSDFTGKWLKIERVGEMQPDSNLYPEYDAELERDMVGETRAFVREILRQNLSLTNLIDSDWAMLNDRMARHYGIPGVEGNQFRRVALNRDETVRGGLLTQASVLNVTSNGTVTSPVVRGVWVLEKLLGTPAPSPPPDVPPIEPDIRGTTTIKDQLAKHREIPQCGACHRKIDPYGMALENFDVIGAWRENYRALKPGPNPKRPVLSEGQSVDASDELPGHGTFAGFREFRRQLLTREDLVFENVARTLAVYALGREMDFSDEVAIRDLSAATRDAGGGMKTLIHRLIESDLFHQP
ncbi:MAG: DUF1592 domain-containing protein [Verrucomicrobiae bacterium]|nr:DUF1592 domain-containing protein [Verrucomicrobiae bacterium]